MKKVVLALTAVIIMAAAITAQAQDTSVPPLISYQGMLTDANSNPMAGTKKLTFNIYDTAAGGNVIWVPQVFDGVPLIGGRFSVILGTTDTAGRLISNAFSAKNRYLGIKVDSNTEIAPRQQILSTPFAIQAEHAAKADHADVAEKVMYGSIHHPCRIVTASHPNGADCQANEQLVGGGCRCSGLTTGGYPDGNSFRCNQYCTLADWKWNIPATAYAICCEISK